MAQSGNISKQLIAILDAGAQYGKVIDRKIRGLGLESIVLPMATPASDLKSYSAIVISGGPQSVYSAAAPVYDPAIFKLDIPMLGICYGMQLMAREAGGEVTLGTRREDGPCTIVINPSSLLFDGLKPTQEVLMSHGDAVKKIPSGFKAVGKSTKIVAAIENPGQKRYGVQFHPEVDLTEHGQDILRNFFFKIAGLKPDFTIEDRKEKAIAEIQRQVGQKKVLMLVSGGVDSTVCAALVNEALGAAKVIAVHIDTGFMRQNESQQVQAALEANGLKLRVIDASSNFYTNLAEITDPEVKRKIIGNTFILVAEAAIAELGLKETEIVLAQGTLRPDLIESASSLASNTAQTIKTHHNDSPAVRRIRQAGRVIEPLKDYHKDEVRELGTQLGLPEQLIWRQPFPGPGLAIRILCADQPYADKNFKLIQQGIARYATKEIQTHLLPVRTVGVQGDGRTYGYLVGLSGSRNWLQLIQLAREIPKSVHGVNRVVFIFGEPISAADIVITPTHLTLETVQQLRQADAIVNEMLSTYGLLRKLSQVPVISFPINFGIIGNRSIALRTFMTNDFMTGVPALPGKDIPETFLLKMVDRILTEVKGISRVVYDLTSKPPGTTEWE